MALEQVPILDEGCAHELLRVACLGPEAPACPLLLQDIFVAWIGQQPSVLVDSQDSKDALELLWYFLKRNLSGDAGYASPALHASVLEVLAVVPAVPTMVAELVPVLSEAAHRLLAANRWHGAAALELLQTACVLTARLGTRLPASARSQLARLPSSDHPLQSNLQHLLDAT